MNRSIKLKSIVHTFAALVIFIMVFQFSSIAFRICKTDNWDTVLYVCVNLLGIIYAVYLYTKYVLKKSFADIYLGKPYPAAKWCIIAILMPLFICLFYVVFTDGVFCREVLTDEDRMYALCTTVLSFGIRAGVTEEIIFRGMILSSLQEVWGIKKAVFISSLLFASVHLGNIDISDWRKVVLLIVAVTIAGIALALVTCETGSIWSSVVIHGMYNILSGDGQIFHIDTEQNFPAIWTYTFESENWLLTGIPGTDDLETALPAMIGFLIIIFMAGRAVKKI